MSEEEKVKEELARALRELDAVFIRERIINSLIESIERGIYENKTQTVH